MQYDETRLAGTYGSDIPEEDDDDRYQNSMMVVPYVEEDVDFYDFDNDEPMLWQDEIDDVTEEFPF